MNKVHAALAILDGLESIVSQSFSLHRLSQRIATAASSVPNPLQAARAGIRAQAALVGAKPAIHKGTGTAALPTTPAVPAAVPRRPLAAGPAGRRTSNNHHRTTLRDLMHEYRSSTPSTTILKAKT
ncbi:MAG: hypothetical protein AAB425_15865 [Bdellovibrionota bacterium]